MLQEALEQGGAFEFMPNDSLAILSLLSRSERPLQMKDIRAELDIPRSSAFRLVEELLAEGWLVANGSPRRYAVSWKAAGLGLGMLQNHPHRKLLLPLVLELAEEAGQQAGLAFYESGQLYFSDVVEVAGGRILLNHGTGAFQALSSAAGRAILAHRPQTEVEALLKCGVVKLTESTKVDPGEIRAELARARELGYAVSISELQAGMMGVFSPVLDDSGEPIAAIGLSGTERAHAARIEFMGILVLKWVRQASTLVGARAGVQVA